jgi:hypothetical protein
VNHLPGQFGESNTRGSTLTPGGSCTASIDFKPKTKGILTGDISIVDDAPDSSQGVSLTGIDADLQIVPSKIYFGHQPVHTTSLAKTITISNKSSSIVHFSEILIDGADSEDFSETNNCGGSVAGGARCFVKVKFTPSEPGVRTAEVRLATMVAAAHNLWL